MTLFLYRVLNIEIIFHDIVNSLHPRLTRRCRHLPDLSAPFAVSIDPVRPKKNPFPKTHTLSDANEALDLEPRIFLPRAGISIHDRAATRPLHNNNSG